MNVYGTLVPRNATTLEGFRDWRRRLGEDAPRVHFLQGDLFFDTAPQDYRTHLPVITEINGVLSQLNKDLDLGRYFADGGWLTNPAAGISNEPDGFFVLWETFQSGEAQLAPGSTIELEGRPDMCLEVVSSSSVHKDTDRLRERYAAAGVREYWLVDARQGSPSFELLVLGQDRVYQPAQPDPDGFRTSLLWNHAFRLRRITDRLGEPDYRLDLRGGSGS